MNILILLLAGSMGFAKTSPELKAIDAATAFLRENAIYAMPVEKTVTSDLLGKTTVSQGKILVGHGKFRWDTTAPEKSLVLFDGKTLWTMQNGEGPAQVTKARVGKASQQQVLLKILSDRAAFSGKFKLLDSKVDGDVHADRLEPLKPDPSIRDFSLKLAAGQLSEIAYTDEVGNKTTIKIQDIAKTDRGDGVFKMEIPKGAEVNEL